MGDATPVNVARPGSTADTVRTVRTGEGDPADAVTLRGVTVEHPVIDAAMIRGVVPEVNPVSATGGRRAVRVAGTVGRDTGARVVARTPPVRTDPVVTTADRATAGNVAGMVSVAKAVIGAARGTTVADTTVPAGTIADAMTTRPRVTARPVRGRNVGAHGHRNPGSPSG
jgi:hypothetical protein